MQDPFKYTLNMAFIKVTAKARTAAAIAVGVISLLEGNGTPLCPVRSPYCSELNLCRPPSLCSDPTCTVQLHQPSPAQQSHHISVSPHAIQGPVLFLMIQRFVLHFEVVITPARRTGHVEASLLPHSLRVGLSVRE